MSTERASRKAQPEATDRTTSRHLLLVDGPVDGDLVRSRLRTDRSDIAFHVVVPARDLSDGEERMVDVENSAPDSDTTPEVRAAQWRLRSAMDALETAGFDDVTGVIGDPDPVEAVSSALDQDPYDDVVVLTKPIGISGWVHLDLPHRIERHVDQPVIHIEVDDVTA